MKRISFTILMLTLALGCASSPNPKTGPGPYTGPTDPLDVLIQRINARTADLATCWLAGDFELDLRQDGQRDFLNGSFILMYQRERHVRMVADKIGTTVFDMGLADEKFWLNVPEGPSTCWYGTIDPTNPLASNQLPIRPDALLDVVGIEPIKTDLIKPPVPTLRFNPDYDAYMVTWHVASIDRWITQREVWYDRATLEPRFVWLFDQNGRVIVRARLTDYATVEGSTVTMPRRVHLLFVESSSTLNLKIDDARRNKGKVPNARSFQFDPAGSGAAKVIDLNEPRR